MAAVRKRASFHMNSSSSDTSGTSSSSLTDSPVRRFNRLVRAALERHWAFIKRAPDLKSRGRSISDAGICNIVENVPIYTLLPEPELLSKPLRRSFHGTTSSTNALIPQLYLTSAGGSSSAVLSVEEPSETSDGERRKRSQHLRVPSPHPHYIQSTGNFASGAGGGGATGTPRSAPATPLQLEAPHHRNKHDKQVVKPISSSTLSVRTATLTPSGAGAGDVCSDASEGGGKAPSKARQKKFFRHFPQVGPEEKVLNYYSCALVGDILLQGHLYITKNYFAFYSNVFGYVTKLLIPTSSVVRVSKEKMARIIPNAVGVCTRDERHVFGSLLSRDSTHKLMTRVWKQARVERPLPTPPPSELRISEGDGASEYSPEDESSSGGGGDNVVLATNGKRRDNDVLPTHPAVCAPGAVIQPAELTGAVRGAGRAAAGAGGGAPTTLLLAALLLTLSAIVLAYMLYSRTYLAQEDLSELSGERLHEELVRWRTKIHGQAASELEAFLSTNLLLLTKVRQSLEALSGIILTDMSNTSTSPLAVEVPNDSYS